MKFERIKKSHTKGIVIGVISVSALILLAVYAGSRAKYKVTQSIPLVNGTINYEIGDFNVVAMYTSEDGTNYTEVDKMPESGYEINEEKSYCKVNGEKDPNARLYTNANGEHIVGNLQKNSKCYVWFDKKLCNGVGCKTILVNNNSTTGSTGFTGPSSSSEASLLSSEDGDGTTYYFRGNVTNNWVQFAGFYWRIIRINGDGSIRMIYNGTSTTTTGTKTQLQISAYNSSYNDNAYVGYMYGATGSSTYADTHENTNNSTIKEIIDTWYKTNIVDKGYSNKISMEAGFCNDRSTASSSETWWTIDTKLGYGTNVTAYGPWSRIRNSGGSHNSTQTPKFTCTNKTTDLFTASGSSKGNKKLIYPVGLITMDEVVFAGGFGGTANSSYYLYTNQYYWTMSPYIFGGGRATMFYVYTAGDLDNNYVNSTFGVRPVINISSDVKLTGSGTTSDPYKVV